MTTEHGKAQAYIGCVVGMKNAFDRKLIMRSLRELISHIKVKQMDILII